MLLPPNWKTSSSRLLVKFPSIVEQCLYINCANTATERIIGSPDQLEEKLKIAQEGEREAKRQHVAGERVLPPKDPAISPWKEIDLANRSFGQSVALTPIQIATAYSAMVNGGFLVAPRVVSAVGERRLVSAPGRRVLSAGTRRRGAPRPATACDRCA